MQDYCVVSGVEIQLVDIDEINVAKSLQEKGMVSDVKMTDYGGSMTLTDEGETYLIKRHNLPKDHPALQ